MKDINNVVVNERLKYVKEGFENLKKFLKISKKEFLKDKKLIGAVKYELIKKRN